MSRPKRPEPKSWSGLSENQQRVIAWMVENKKDHLAAIKENMVSSNTLYGMWTLARVEQWKVFYREHLRSLEPPPSPEEELQRQIDDLASLAVNVMRHTLEYGVGNATAVRAAQWVLDGVKAAHAQSRGPHIEVPHAAPDSAEKELAAVLRLVR